MADKNKLCLILNLIADRIDEEISNLELELSDVEGLDREPEWWHKESNRKVSFLLVHSQLFRKPPTDNPENYELRPTGELVALSGLRLLSERFRDYGFEMKQEEEDG